MPHNRNEGLFHPLRSLPASFIQHFRCGLFKEILECTCVRQYAQIQTRQHTGGVLSRKQRSYIWWYRTQSKNRDCIVDTQQLICLVKCPPMRRTRWLCTKALSCLVEWCSCPEMHCREGKWTQNARHNVILYIQVLNNKENAIYCYTPAGRLAP